jgi:lysophospholipid acyltransferase (LPLAT)-like uncharacterized protein
MNLRKRLLRAGPVQSALAWLVAQYIRLLFLTTQWTVVCPPDTERSLAKGHFIACFWHGRMIMMRAALPRGVTMHVLISEHRDGQLISRALAGLGVATVAASSRRGGAAALRSMSALLDRGESVGITPDGPRGPRMRAKAGAIKAAQLSGVPVLPVSGAVGRRRILGTWDSFCLALPFSRGVIQWGEPIEVPRQADDADLERLRLLLEDQLNRLTAEADRRFGQAAIVPAAKAPAATDSAPDGSAPDGSAPDGSDKDRARHARA